MKTKSILSLIVGTALALTACSDDDNINSYSVAYNTNLTYVTDNSTGTSSVNAPVTVEMTFDYVKKNVSVKVANLQLSQDRTVSFNIPASPFTTENGVSVLEIASLDLGNVNIKNLYLTFVEGLYTWNDYAQLCNIKMDVDQYSVTVLQDSRFFLGTTEVKGPGAGEPYTNDAMYYKVTLNPDRSTADVTIYNVKFAENMPVQSEITLPGVKFVPQQGGYKLMAESVVPLLANGSPKPEYAITNFMADWDFKTSMSVSYNMAVFTVTSTLH